MGFIPGALTLLVLTGGQRPVRALQQHDEAALLWAAHEGRLDAVRALLNGGVHPDARGEQGWTPLMVAAEKGHVDIVHALLAHGADVGTRNDVDRTALMVAAQNGRTRVVNALLFAGAEPDATTASGVTALMIAARNGHTDVCNALLRRGADANAVDVYGWAPLIHAALYGHTAVAAMLLEHGGEVHAVDRDGVTPIEAALLQDHADVVRLLREAGAVPSPPPTGIDDARDITVDTAWPGDEALAHLGEVFRAVAVDEPPALISCTPPRYPRVMLRAQVEGEVLVGFVVDRDGTVLPQTVAILGSTHRAFERSAMEVPGQCQFRPGRVQGSAVRVLVVMPMAFTLEEGAPRPGLRRIRPSP